MDRNWIQPKYFVASHSGAIPRGVENNLIQFQAVLRIRHPDFSWSQIPNFLGKKYYNFLASWLKFYF